MSNSRVIDSCCTALSTDRAYTARELAELLNEEQPSVSQALRSLYRGGGSR